MSQDAILYDIVIRCAWPVMFFTVPVLLPIPWFLQNFSGVIQDIWFFALFYFCIFAHFYFCIFCTFLLLDFFICQGIQLAFVTGGCNMLQLHIWTQWLGVTRVMHPRM